MSLQLLICGTLFPVFFAVVDSKVFYIALALPQN